MIRSILTGMLGLLSIVAVGSVPVACQSGGVGDPCTPEDEYNPQFAGFKVTEENIESRSFQCQTRICLVNHFQGRVSCPLGQQAPVACSPGGSECGGDGECVRSSVFAPECESSDDCGGRTCNEGGKFCECQSATDCPLDGLWFCNADENLGPRNQCLSFVCHKPGVENCQNATNTPEQNEGKACCVPGTDTPVASPVCGQCAADAGRDAEQSVYCSCRCGVAEGEEEDPDFNFCECPTGFTCSEIRKNVGLGDQQITGKYCIKEGTEFQNEQQCGNVEGYHDSTQCKGIGI